MKYDWNDVISKIDKDIAEYLEKRFEDYCTDRNESIYLIYEEYSPYYNPEKIRRHEAKKDQLIELGIKLSMKLSFWEEESRKELFEQAYKDLKTLDKFIKDKNEEFCKKLKEENKALPLDKQKNTYTLDCEKTDKEEYYLKLKEKIRDKEFIEMIDKRRAEYEKKKTEYEKKKIEYEKIELKKKAEEERIANKKGHSNIKPLSFYERLYCRYGAPFGNKIFYIYDEDYEKMENERDFDIYFEEKGRPNTFDIRCLKKKPLKYKPDSLEDNKYYLDRCKQLLEVFKPFEDEYEDEYEDDFNYLQAQIDIYQEYLDKDYLITRQIAHLSRQVGKIFWNRIDYETQKRLSAFDKPQYLINIFDDDSFDIKEIKIKVNKFIGGEEEGEVKILTPIESLKEYLKKHSNRITAREYSKLVNITYKKALVVLKGFVANKELKSKKEYRGLYVFYIWGGEL